MSHITTSTDQNVLVIEIDPASLNDFDLTYAVENEIDDAFQRLNTKNAVIDLQNVNILESVGLRVFVRMLQKTETGSGRGSRRAIEFFRSWRPAREEPESFVSVRS